jgi:hypothetical protein
MTVSTFAAVAIVSFNAVALDQAHIAAAPRGIVEVGELTLVEAAPMAAATLPEVAVVAKRERMSNAYLAGITKLPEIVVVGEHAAYVAAGSGYAGQATPADTAGSAASVLLH